MGWGVFRTDRTVKVRWLQLVQNEERGAWRLPEASGWRRLSGISLRVSYSPTTGPGGCGPVCKWKLPDSGCCQLTKLSFKAALAPEQWVLRAETMAPAFHFSWLLVVWLVVTTAEGKSLIFYLLCVGYIINTIQENRCGFHGYRFPYIGNVYVCYHQPVWMKWKAGFAHLKTWILVLRLWF